MKIIYDLRALWLLLYVAVPSFVGYSLFAKVRCSVLEKVRKVRREEKEKCDCLLRPCLIAAGQKSLPESTILPSMVQVAKRTPLILRGKLSCEAPSVCSRTTRASISKHSLLFGPKMVNIKTVLTSTRCRLMS